MGTYYIRDKHNDTLVEIEVSQSDGVVTDVSSQVDLRLYSRILLTEPWATLASRVQYIDQMCGWSEFRGYWWESHVLPKGKDFEPKVAEADELIRSAVAELGDIIPSRGLHIITD